jgi:hypothetical protein
VTSLQTYSFLGSRLCRWLAHIVTNFVNAQNVSISHLAYENTLLNDPNSALGGRAYCCTDPNPPIVYGDLYKALSTLAHPMHPVKFPNIPGSLLLLLAYCLESYSLLRHRYLRFLPPITGDLAIVQPAVFQMASIHLVYDDSLAQKEIGYKAPITTLEGLCHQVLWFNELVEAKVEKQVAEGKGGEVMPDSPSTVPKPPSSQ